MSSPYRPDEAAEAYQPGRSESRPLGRRDGGDGGIADYVPQREPPTPAWHDTGAYPYHSDWSIEQAAKARQALQRRSRRKRWITMSVIVGLLLCTVSGALVYQWGAPIASVLAYCTYIETGSYRNAYDLMSHTLQRQTSLTQFGDAARALDSAEGKIVSCAPPRSTFGFGYHRVGVGNDVRLELVMRRKLAGSLIGIVHLKYEGAAWKVDRLEGNLFGASLLAVYTVDEYCHALVRARYDTAFGFLSSNVAGKTKLADFMRAAQQHDQAEGAITACAIVAVGDPNTDAVANLTISITRARGSVKQGPVALAVDQGAWKISVRAPE